MNIGVTDLNLWNLEIVRSNGVKETLNLELPEDRAAALADLDEGIEEFYSPFTSDDVDDIEELVNVAEKFFDEWHEVQQGAFLVSIDNDLSFSDAVANAENEDYTHYADDSLYDIGYEMIPEEVLNMLEKHNLTYYFDFAEYAEEALMDAYYLRGYGYYLFY